MVKKILSRTDPPVWRIRRPWKRVTTPGNPTLVMVMARRNYKVYANIGVTVPLMQRMLAILDTGAGPNFIRRSELPKGSEAFMASGPLPNICDANNNPLRTIGMTKLPVRLGRLLVRVEFIVCDTLAAPVILGADYCDKFVEAIRPRQKLVELEDGSSVPITRRPMKRVGSVKSLPFHPEDSKSEGRLSPKVKAATTTVIPPESQRFVLVTSVRCGLLVVQPHTPLYDRHGLCATNGVVQVEPSRPFHLLVANLTQFPRRIQKNQIVATVLPHPTAALPTPIMFGEVLGVLDDKDPEDQGANAKGPTPVAGDAGPTKFEDLDLEHVPEGARDRLRQTLKKYASMWDGSLGEIKTVEHHIDLSPGTRPMAQAPYRAGPKAREIEQMEVNRMLDAGVIEPAQSAWASPVVLVPKPDGSLRFCVDYRRLNAATIRDIYPIPRMDECIDSLGDANIFTTLDCNSGYWQIPVSPEDRDKTAFTCHSGLYRYKRMPFGLTNAPATFQRTLDILLSPFRWRSCLVYLDDVIVFSKNIDQPLAQVDEILQVLKNAGISLKLKKCSFCTDTVTYLGHIIRPGQLSIDKTRVSALREAKYPRTQTQLRSFLGLCNVYRRFVKDFAKKAHPLNALLRKGRPGDLESFGEKEKAAFKALVDEIIEPPILALPRRGLPYSIDTDASKYQLGAALFQTHLNEERKPIGFFSRTLIDAELNYSVSEQECLAVVWALTTLRPYLQGENFIVHTDHSSLRWLMNINDPSGRLMRWRLRLSEFDFEVQYKKGKANTQADALSRLQTLGETTASVDDAIPCFIIGDPDVESSEGKTEDFGPCDAILALGHEDEDQLEPITPEELLREQSRDPFCQGIRSRLEDGERIPFSTDTAEGGGLLTRTSSERNQIVIPPPLRERILKISHYARTSAHPGGRRLYTSLRRDFYWPSMAMDCYAVARSCTSCARNRIKLRKNSKEMTLFPAHAPLEFVAIDILGELITSRRGYRYLLVITDRFSKLTRTVPLKRITAATVATAFVHHWVFTYGPPIKLLSDNGSQFTSKFFQNVCRILGVNNVFTTTYHPQTNGQAERFNRTILAALRHYVADHPRDWDLFTGAITFAYNSQVHRTTNLAPFELVLARAPKSLAVQAQPVLEEFNSARQYHLKWQSWLSSLMTTARKSLHKEQARYKRNFDARLRKPAYEVPVGSYVFLRKEFVDKKESKHKLSPVATGPYRVAEVNKDTVVIIDGTMHERVSRDRVELAPNPIDQPRWSPSPALEGPASNTEIATRPLIRTPRVMARLHPAGICRDGPAQRGLVDLQGPVSDTSRRAEGPVASWPLEDALREPEINGKSSSSLRQSPEQETTVSGDGSSPVTRPPRENVFQPLDRSSGAHPSQGGTESELPLPTGTEGPEPPPRLTRSQTRAQYNRANAHALSAKETPPLAPPSTPPDDPAREYVIDKIVEHEEDGDGNLFLKVRWYGYEPKDDTWQLVSTLPRSKVVQYYSRQRLPLPEQVEDAIAG